VRFRNKRFSWEAVREFYDRFLELRHCSIDEFLTGSCTDVQIHGINYRSEILECEASVVHLCDMVEETLSVVECARGLFCVEGSRSKLRR
jgi:hypothetical protein